MLILSPVAVSVNVVVLWFLVVNSMFIVLNVVNGIVHSQFFAPPPYGFTPTQIGYMALGPFTGALLASAALAALSDPLIKWCARHNNGVYEPEFRLIPCVVGSLCNVGLMLWGHLVEEKAAPGLVAFMSGIMAFGVFFIIIPTSNYTLDANRNMSNEIFVAALAVKNFTIYGFSYWVNDWVESVGAQYAFFVWGGLGWALLATFPIVYVYGKKYRSFWVRHNLLEKWHIQTHAAAH